VLTLVDRAINAGQQAEQPTLTGLLTKVDTQSFLRVTGLTHYNIYHKYL